MKLKNYLLLMLFISLLSSCFTMPPPYYQAHIVDYSAFTQKGIFVTESDNIKFDYIAIGSVRAEGKGGWTQEVKKKAIGPDLNKLFEELAETLAAQNANGIINLKVHTVPEKKYFYNNYIVTGMAVHIKEDISHLLK
ncbi:MAG: hypothetical protein LUF85_02920 [Bacteroides sp.]|nr:hypothetical protein [Bacteroides sp.]